MGLLSSAESVDINAKPFLKWAGGKGQLLGEISKYYPFDKGITKYAEPFIGGGAVLFDILNNYSIDEVYISDRNAELINAYCTVRDNVDALVENLLKLQKEFVPLNSEDRREYYNKMRCEFNELNKCSDERFKVNRAALMIFLNKTCFNGLYRVNKKGQFNVPMGAYKNPLICDIDNLIAVSKRLKNVRIELGDYRKSVDFIDKNTFVYFDPPYRPLTSTASFTAYTEFSFDDAAQLELAEFATKMSERGAKIVVSNSDPKNVDENDNFFDIAYSVFDIKRVEVPRMINCNSQARGKIRELLISNIK